MVQPPSSAKQARCGDVFVRNVRRLMSRIDRKSTRLNSSHSQISYAVFCLKKKKNIHRLVVVIPAMNFFLNFVGGLFTSTCSALSVSEWPLSFCPLLPQLLPVARVK